MEGRTRRDGAGQGPAQAPHLAAEAAPAGAGGCFARPSRPRDRARQGAAAAAAVRSGGDLLDAVDERPTVEGASGGGAPGRRLWVPAVLAPVAETALLLVVGPRGAAALGPQLTAPPPLDLLHDLRWVATYHNSWLSL